MKKRPRPIDGDEPKILPNYVRAAEAYAKYMEEEEDSDEEEEPQPTYDLATLSHHINTFDTDPEIIPQLLSLGFAKFYHETLREEVVTKWFKELQNLWGDTVTPDQATDLVMDVLLKVRGHVFGHDLQGFCCHYGLPGPKPTKGSPSSSMKEPCSDEKEEHHGASAFADRVAKPPRTEPPIGGRGAGDGVSDSSAGEGSNLSGDEPKILPNYIRAAEAYAKYMEEESSDEDEEEEPQATYDFATLSHHINTFDTDPKIIPQLLSLGFAKLYDERMREEVVTKWFKELRNLWGATVTPDQATNLVMDVLQKVSGGVYHYELKCFCCHYGLPDPKPTKGSPSSR